MLFYPAGSLHSYTKEMICEILQLPVCYRDAHVKKHGSMNISQSYCYKLDGYMYKEIEAVLRDGLDIFCIHTFCRYLQSLISVRL